MYVYIYMYIYMCVCVHRLLWRCWLVVSVKSGPARDSLLVSPPEQRVYTVYGWSPGSRVGCGLRFYLPTETVWGRQTP